VVPAGPQPTAVLLGLESIRPSQIKRGPYRPDSWLSATPRASRQLLRGSVLHRPCLSGAAGVM